MINEQSRNEIDFKLLDGTFFTQKVDTLHDLINLKSDGDSIIASTDVISALQMIGKSSGIHHCVKIPFENRQPFFMTKGTIFTVSGLV